LQRGFAAERPDITEYLAALGKQGISGTHPDLIAHRDSTFLHRLPYQRFILELLSSS
jgi:hypothetical protein